MHGITNYLAIRMQLIAKASAAATLEKSFSNTLPHAHEFGPTAIGLQPDHKHVRKGHGALAAAAAACRLLTAAFFSASSLVIE